MNILILLYMNSLIPNWIIDFDFCKLEHINGIVPSIFVECLWLLLQLTSLHLCCI